MPISYLIFQNAVSYTNTFDPHHFPLLEFFLEQPLFMFILTIPPQPLLTKSPLSHTQLPN